MEITRNKVHIAMWEDEADRIAAALYTALDLFEDYRKRDADTDDRWNSVIEAEGVINALFFKLREIKPARHPAGLSIQEELRRALAPLEQVGGR
jgi:hypothetical protein